MPTASILKARRAVFNIGGNKYRVVVDIDYLRQAAWSNRGLTPKDLEVFIGSSGRVSEVLSGKRGLSLRMIKRLHEGLKIPYENLMAAG